MQDQKQRSPLTDWFVLGAAAIISTIISAFTGMFILFLFMGGADSITAAIGYWFVYFIFATIFGLFLRSKGQSPARVFFLTAGLTISISSIYWTAVGVLNSDLFQNFEPEVYVSYTIRIVADAPTSSEVSSEALIYCCSKTTRIDQPVILPFEFTFTETFTTEGAKGAWITISVVRTYEDRSEYVADDGMPTCEIWVDGELLVKNIGTTGEVQCSTLPWNPPIESFQD